MTRSRHRPVRGAGRLDLGGGGELMGQRAKRTTTVTVDLGELKAPWQAWCHVHGFTPKRERAPARIELNLTTSEPAALKQIAGHEGYLPTEWVVVRTRLTGDSQGGQPELQGVARSNLQLLALGRP